MPIALKVILNIIFFIVYIIVFSLIAGLLLGAYMNMGGGDGANMATEFYEKFQIILAFVILVTTILLKKYFYIPLSTKEEVVLIDD